MSRWVKPRSTSLSHPRRHKTPSLEALETRELLATFRVNTIADSVAVNLKTGRDATGKISLRSALMAANSKPAADTIILPAGVFSLELHGANEDAGKTGDLDIHHNVTIKGASAAVTIIDGNQNGANSAGATPDRVFDIHGGKVNISRLTIQNGSSSSGAGIRVQRGIVALANVVVSSNFARGTDGTDGTAGTHDFRNDQPFDSGLAGEAATGGDGTDGVAGGNAKGGGIYNAGALSLTNTSFVGNTASGGRGGKGGAGGEARGGGGSLTAAGGNASGGNGGRGGDGGMGLGGSLFNAKGGKLTISGSIVRQNTAFGGVGGVSGGAGSAVGGNGGTGFTTGNGGTAVSGEEFTSGNGGSGAGGGLYNQGTVTFTGATSKFLQNRANGGIGGDGFTGAFATAAGGNGGAAFEGSGGGRGGDASAKRVAAGGAGGNAAGGAVYNAPTAVVIAESLIFKANSARGGSGVRGGLGGDAGGGTGGKGGRAFITFPPSTPGPGGRGGDAHGGDAGQAGAGGTASGGAFFNDTDARFMLVPPKRRGNAVLTSQFLKNEAIGGLAAQALPGGTGIGGLGGAGGGTGTPPPGRGGDAGDGFGGNGGKGGDAGAAQGGALFNVGIVAFTGVVVSFEENRATALAGGAGGDAGGFGVSFGGAGTPQGGAGTQTAGQAGASGSPGIATGGGIHAASTSRLKIDPGKGARRSSKQAKATSSIRKNIASGPPTKSFGGGVLTVIGAVLVTKDTTITGNQAETGADTFELVR